MKQELIDAMQSLEGLWRVPDGPLYRLRQGLISSESVDQVVSALEAVELPPDTRELDRLLVALLWDMPFFVEIQRERVAEKSGEEARPQYNRLRGRTFEEVERLLGLGHIDHDVDRWFSDDS